MLPIEDIPSSFQDQTQFTYSITPTATNIDLPGYVKTSCLMSCISKCSKDKDSVGFNLGDDTEYPLPLPMAPRETFNNMFVRHKDETDDYGQNVNYRMNMDYTVDYETSLNTIDKIPFEETKFKPENTLGESIPIKPAEVVNKNPLLDVSEPILPVKESNNEVSKADIPIYDLLSEEYKKNGKAVSDYAKIVREYGTKSMKGYLDIVQGTVGNIKFTEFLKDNVKTVALLIGISSILFMFNNLITLGVVSIVFIIALKNAKNIF
ncbi:hypothetical protein PBCVCviKI_439R [Paramecium bursaria Chlorella virus CviKI]|nr:hypothetical protein PBCVCviKI_439R [Paramecium bursaria Chlorella virus CviKI]